MLLTVSFSRRYARVYYIPWSNKVYTICNHCYPPFSVSTFEHLTSIVGHVDNYLHLASIATRGRMESYQLCAMDLCTFVGGTACSCACLSCCCRERFRRIRVMDGPPPTMATERSSSLDAECVRPCSLQSVADMGIDGQRERRAAKERKRARRGGACSLTPAPYSEG